MLRVELGLSSKGKECVVIRVVVDEDGESDNVDEGDENESDSVPVTRSDRVHDQGLPSAAAVHDNDNDRDTLADVSE